MLAEALTPSARLQSLAAMTLSLSPSPQCHHPLRFLITTHRPFPPTLSLRRRPHSHLHASRRGRVSDFPQGGGGGGGLLSDARNWSRAIDSAYGDEGEDGSDEEEDRSLDLLVRFVQNVFRKISRRARKAVRSVLPVSISTQLVNFSVHGVLILAFLWVLKAFLEVVCTLGSAVFISILLIRGVWSGVTDMQENRSYKMNEADDDHRAWSGAQPVT